MIIEGQHFIQSSSPVVESPWLLEVLSLQHPGPDQILDLNPKAYHP